MSVSSPPQESDVIIAGGGLAGTLLAHALLSLGLRVAMVEVREPRILEQPSFDGRSTALANGTVRILDKLGLWSAIEAAAQPITHIHIGQQGHFGVARIDASEEGVDALGFTAENRLIGEALWTRLEDRDGFLCLAPARVAAFETDAEGVSVSVLTDTGESTVRGKLLIAADGARSTIRQTLGIGTKSGAYGQRAVVANCVFKRDHRGAAFERFTRDGPLALLPLRGKCALVWSLPEDRAEQVLALSDDEFASQLQKAFGNRLGPVTRVGIRASYPLFRMQSDSVIAERTVLIGNAAVSMHPVAGQSFNLAVRDIASLAELIGTVRARDAAGDIGGPQLLAEFSHWRKGDQRATAWFTHSLVAGMGLDIPGLGVLRGLALTAFDILPGSKRALARHTMGLAGRVPRLARGLDLN